MSGLPLKLAEPALPLVPADPRPAAIAVLEDWLAERLEGWKVDHGRDWLDLCARGRKCAAPATLVEQAEEAAWAHWRTITGPARLVTALTVARGRGTVGQLHASQIAAARRAHEQALCLAMVNGLHARKVRTWLVDGRYGCASDEVRFVGALVTVHRLHRITEDSQQAINWPRRFPDVPEGWVREGSYIRRSGAD